MTLLGILLFVVMVRCHLSQAAESQEQALDVFHKKISKLGNLKKIGNFGTIERNSSSALQEDIATSQLGNYVGVTILVENYSSALLADPQSALTCGYQSAALSQLHALPPGSADLMVFHNHNYLHRRTCGSASWQVKHSDGTPYRLESEEGFGVRVSLTWNVHWTCSHTILNEVTVNLMKTRLNLTGEWANPMQDHIYSNKHHYWQHNSFPLDHTERVAREDGYGFNVTASITSGCQALLTLQVLGNGEFQIKTKKRPLHTHIGTRPTTTITTTTTMETSAPLRSSPATADSTHQAEGEGVTAEDAATDIRNKIEGSVGVVILVENHSGKLLDDLQLHADCGWVATGLTTEPVLPMERDVLVFHNFYRATVRSCGSASWQIKNNDGTAFLLDSKNQFGLRLIVTWNVHSWCEGKKNEVSVYLMQVEVDEDGNWLNPVQSKIYTLKHKYWQNRLQQEEEGSSERRAVESEGSLSAMVSITAGCKAVIELALQEQDVEIGSVDGDADLGELLPLVSNGGAATTMTVVYVVCGFAAFLVLFVVVKGFCMLKNMRQIQDEDYYDQEEVDRFLK